MKCGERVNGWSDIRKNDVYEVFVCVGFLSVVSNFYWTFKKENVDITFRLFTLTSQRV